MTIAGEGTYTVNGDGTITFTPEPDFVGTATPITYQVTDSLGRTVSSTYTPTVTSLPATSAPGPNPGPAPEPAPEPALRPEPEVEPEPEPEPVVELQPDPGPVDRGDPAKPVVEPQFDKTMVNPGQAVMLDPMIGAKPTPGATFVASSMQLWNGQAWVKRVRQPGVGTWVVRGGNVMFMPDRDYIGTAKGMFRVRDTSGAWAQNMLTVIVEPRPVSSVGISVLPKTGGFPVPLSLLAGLLMGVLGSVLVRIGLRRS